MGVIGAIWRGFVRPIGMFLFTVGGCATAFNEIGDAHQTLEEWGYIDVAYAAIGHVVTFLASNWIVTIICATITLFMYYIFIHEPYLYARRNEAAVLEQRDSDE